MPCIASSEYPCPVTIHVSSLLPKAAIFLLCAPKLAWNWAIQQTEVCWANSSLWRLLPWCGRKDKEKLVSLFPYCRGVTSTTFPRVVKAQAGLKTRHGARCAASDFILHDRRTGHWMCSQGWALVSVHRVMASHSGSSLKPPLGGQTGERQRSPAAFSMPSRTDTLPGHGSGSFLLCQLTKPACRVENKIRECTLNAITLMQNKHQGWLPQFQNKL